MSAPAPVLNNSLVAQSWVRQIPLVAALATPPPVGLTLPANPASWAVTGYLQVLTVGGSPDLDYPLHRPVVTVFAWATVLGSKKPPWAMAGRLAHYVFNACYAERTVIRKILSITLGGETYPPAQIIEATALTEPREVPGDPSGYARYQLDFELMWVQPS